MNLQPPSQGLNTQTEKKSHKEIFKSNLLFQKICLYTLILNLSPND